jgi:hypothetical protein
MLPPANSVNHDSQYGENGIVEAVPRPTLRAQLDQHLRGHAVAPADEAAQDLMGADGIVAELRRLAQRQLEHLLGPAGERDVPRRDLIVSPCALLDSSARPGRYAGARQRVTWLRGVPLGPGASQHRISLNNALAAYQHSGGRLRVHRGATAEFTGRT